jgi:hypothetical protein
MMENDLLVHKKMAQVPCPLTLVSASFCKFICRQDLKDLFLVTYSSSGALSLVVKEFSGGP